MMKNEIQRRAVLHKKQYREAEFRMMIAEQNGDLRGWENANKEAETHYHMWIGLEQQVEEME